MGVAYVIKIFLALASQLPANVVFLVILMFLMFLMFERQI